MVNSGNGRDGQNNKDESSDLSFKKKNQEEKRWRTFLDVANVARMERINERERFDTVSRPRSECPSRDIYSPLAATYSDLGPEASDDYGMPTDKNEIAHIDLREYDLYNENTHHYGSKTNPVTLKRPRKPSGIDTDAVRGGNVNEYKDLPDNMFIPIDNQDGRIYPCPFRHCDRVFPSLSRIKRHYVVHTNLKSFKCEHPKCGKRFSRRDNMKQHYRDSCRHVKADKDRGIPKQD